jgi:UDP-N-acetylmuramoyl-tripeptide--D-alanyl-D-alanine ligase
LAVLNFDDDRVRRMAEGRTLRARFFGSTSACQYRAEAAVSRWPERLSFELVVDGQRVDVRTRLVGTHWVNSVLGALAVASVCGIELEEAARSVSRVPPFAGRMQPVRLPNGAMMLRDEENGSPDTLQAMIEVLRDARAMRRGLVFSDQSDTKQNPRKRMRSIGKQAAELCDFAVFVGEHAHHAVRAATAAGMDASSCAPHASLADAAQWLRDFARPGDLVFLKGRGTDHLSRILFAQFGNIGCWKPHCKITRLCDYCGQLKPDFDAEKALANAID